MEEQSTSIDGHRSHRFPSSLSPAAAASSSLSSPLSFSHLEPRRRLGIVLDYERLADEAEGVESVGCHVFLGGGGDDEREE